MSFFASFNLCDRSGSVLLILLLTGHVSLLVGMPGNLWMSAEITTSLTFMATASFFFFLVLLSNYAALTI